MSKRIVASRVLLVLLVFLAVWFSTLRPEAREIIMEVLFGV